MLSYFDNLFVRTSNQYVKWNDQGSSDLTAILLISLFQCINVLSIIFFIGGIFHGRDWVFTKIEILMVSLAILAFDYFRIYHFIGFKKLFEKYNTVQSTRVKLHPIAYFVISIVVFIIVRIIGFYPDIQ